MEVPEDEGAMLYKSMIGVNQTPSGKRRSYIGVNQTPSGRWEAQIRLASKVLRLGTFGTAEAAAAAYDEAASRFRGSTAELNFPKSEPPLPTGEEDGSDSSSGNHKKRRNYRGVWQRASGKWYAQFHDSKIGVHKYSPHVSHSTGNKTKRKYIGIRRKLSGNRDPNKRTIVHLGTLKAAKDAAMVYDEAALKIQGNETTLNFSKRLSLEADPQGVSHSTGNKTIKKRYRGVRQESTGKWIARIYVSKIVGDVCLGRFDTAEEAARAYDEAALKKQYRNGQKPILNFPDREADSRISDAHSVQLLASGEDRPSKRKCGSKSSPGSIPTLPSQEEDQNDQSSPEHQNVGNPVSLDEGNIVKPDSSAQPKEEAFHQNPCQDCVFSSSWSDLSLLGSYVERDRAMSSMMAALNETIHRTFSDIAPCRPIFPHPDDVEGECSEAERNAGDSSIPRTVSPVLEDPMDQRLQEASLSESRSFQDAGSVDHDGSKMMVKVHYKDDIIIKFELSPSSTKLELEEKVAIRLKLSVGSFDVRYEDKDKDWILVACDEDLRTCMSTASSFGSDALKMRIVVSN